FGNPFECLLFSFDNQSNPAPMYYKVSRPDQEPISITSECEQNLEIAVETLAFIVDDVGIEELGTIEDPIPITTDETVSGQLTITEDSPLGYIPIIIKVKQNNVWVSGFIAGRGIVDIPGNTFEIVPELVE
ncbi:hypothetical protein KKE06_02500, partial [Candidatus Micrarchaeota archaeon]|nr:hypothetical protein [Candidatus Micrarchaeota archaeon]MBU1930673.1 hypothetical protein [Candidatus Micrarchaeota archaeon]